MKKNWILSTILFAISFFVLVFFMQFVGFKFNIGGRDVEISGLLEYKGRILDSSFSFNHYTISQFSKSLALFSKTHPYYDTLSIGLWKIVIAFISLSGIGFAYSLTMIFLTDNFEFYGELFAGIFYLIISLGLFITGILGIVGFEYFMKSARLLPGFTSIKSNYIGASIILILGLIPSFSYGWKLYSLLHSD